ncbi:MAG TPA: hypothetical protein VGU01_08330 [Sphingomicrobium sp.]|nr:hypothetical protein [Sphingomicrobium sp.]
MRMSSVFKNRWMALIWAAGILWFAYDFAGSAPPDQTPGNAAGNASAGSVSTDDQNKVEQVLGN